MNQISVKPVLKKESRDEDTSVVKLSAQKKKLSPKSNLKKESIFSFVRGGSDSDEIKSSDEVEKPVVKNVNGFTPILLRSQSQSTTRSQTNQGNILKPIKMKSKTTSTTRKPQGTNIFSFVTAGSQSTRTKSKSTSEFVVTTTPTTITRRPQSNRVIAKPAMIKKESDESEETNVKIPANSRRITQSQKRRRPSHRQHVGGSSHSLRSKKPKIPIPDSHEASVHYTSPGQRVVVNFGSFKFDSARPSRHINDKENKKNILDSDVRETDHFNIGKVAGRKSTTRKTQTSSVTTPERTSTVSTTTSRPTTRFSRTSRPNPLAKSVITTRKTTTSAPSTTTNIPDDKPISDNLTTADDTTTEAITTTTRITRVRPGFRRPARRRVRPRNRQSNKTRSRVIKKKIVNTSTESSTAVSATLPPSNDDLNSTDRQTLLPDDSLMEKSSGKKRLT